MKKNIIITMFIVVAVILAACGNSGIDTNPGSSFDPTQENGSVREIPLSSKLAIGTLKLEDTEFAVGSGQASDLLPLWQVLRSLTESDSTSQEEVNALVEQIQETMTSDQLAAIDAMDLTGENFFAIMQEMDILTQISNDGTDRPSGGFPGGGRPDGGVPGGGPGDGGGPGNGFGGDGSQLSPEQIATAQARRAENGGGFGNRLLAPLTEAVITLLESK